MRFLPIWHPVLSLKTLNENHTKFSGIDLVCFNIVIVAVDVIIVVIVVVFFGRRPAEVGLKVNTDHIYSLRS